jgi:hypothetical protein
MAVRSWERMSSYGFTYGLFNDVDIISDYRASNGKRNWEWNTGEEFVVLFLVLSQKWLRKAWKTLDIRDSGHTESGASHLDSVAITTNFRTLFNDAVTD